MSSITLQKETTIIKTTFQNNNFAVRHFFPSSTWILFPVTHCEAARQGVRDIMGAVTSRVHSPSHNVMAVTVIIRILTDVSAMLPSSGYTRLNTVKKFVKISSRAWWHTRARATWNSALRHTSRVSKKKKEGEGGDSRETKVLVKASRAYSPILEYQPHLLLLTVFLVG